MTAPPDPVTWLILAYRLPANSGLKAVIQRKATALGAVYLANAVAGLPASAAAERALRRLRTMIAEGAALPASRDYYPTCGKPLISRAYTQDP